MYAFGEFLSKKFSSTGQAAARRGYQQQGLSRRFRLYVFRDSLTRETGEKSHATRFCLFSSRRAFLDILDLDTIFRIKNTSPKKSARAKNLPGKKISLHKSSERQLFSEKKRSNSTSRHSYEEIVVRKQKSEIGSKFTVFICKQKIQAHVALTYACFSTELSLSLSRVEMKGGAGSTGCKGIRVNRRERRERNG